MVRMYRVQQYILTFLLFGATFAINPWLTTDIYEFPKFVVLVAATSVLAITVILRPIRFPKIFLWPVILLLGNVIAFVFSTNPGISLSGAPLRFQGFLSQIYYLLTLVGSFYFFSMAPTLLRHRIFRWLAIIMIAACVVALIGYFFPLPFIDPSLYFNRVYGTFGNPNYLAVFLVGTLPFLILAEWKRKFVWVVCLFFGVATFFFTGSRSAWVALICGFFILGIFRALVQKRYAVLGSAVGITVGLIILIIFQHYAPTISLERFSLQGGPALSVQTRVDLWRAGIQLFLTRPITGFGQDNIKGNIEPFVPERLRENEVFFIDRTHSEFIDVLVTTGILGAIGYVGFFVTLLWRSMCAMLQEKFTDAYFSAAFVGFLSLALFHAVNFGTVTSNMLFYFLAGFLIVCTAKRKYI